MMKNLVRTNVKTACIVTIGLVITLIPYSLLLGWNTITLFIFWFAIIPTIAIYLPKAILHKKTSLLGRLIGLMTFYGLMIFMIYKHFKTDYFQVMIVSALINTIVVSLNSLILEIDKKKSQTAT